MLFPRLQFYLLLDLACMLQVLQGIQFSFYGTYQMVFSN